MSRKFFSFSASPINWEKESEDEGTYGVASSSVPASGVGMTAKYS